MGLAYAATGVSRSATSLKSVNALFCFNVHMIELYEGKRLHVHLIVIVIWVLSKYSFKDRLDCSLLLNYGLIFGGFLWSCWASVFPCMSTHTTPVDAAYEGVQKCTFLAMAIMLCLLLPILVTLMLLYPKLGKLREKQIAAASSLGTEPNNDKDSIEFSQLMPERHKAID